MLPLTLYFSDEYRLMSASQLFRAVQQAALCATDTLKQQLQELELTFLHGEGNPVESGGTLDYFIPPEKIPLAYTGSQANHRFNVYLNAIESQANTSAPDTPTVTVDPLALHPNCSASVPDATQEILLRKLIALGQIAQAQGVRLQLTEPDEGQLELWLQLIAGLMAELPEAPLGITLGAGSKRLLPALGYLARLGLDLERGLTICLVHRGIQSDSHSRSNAVSAPDIDTAEVANLNYAAACAFFESGNNTRLEPELVIGDPALRPIITSLCNSHDWPIRFYLSEPGPLPARRASPYPTPCTLAGIQSVSAQFAQALDDLNDRPIQATPIIAGADCPDQEEKTLFRPGAIDTSIGAVVPITEAQARTAYSICDEAQTLRHESSFYERSIPIEAFANLLAQRQIELATLCACETGKSINDCLLEIEDALRLISRHLALVPELSTSRHLTSIEGTESEQVAMPRGTLVGILPWNQPILQFSAMSSAALLTGNAILFKPDTRASLIGARLFRLLLQAGTPAQLVALMPGALETAGKYLLDDYRLAAVLFSGSPLAATDIQRCLGKRVGAQILPLLSDTGGCHAAIIDADQTITELLPRLLKAAFSCAGQHPASLRILYLEESIADSFERSLADALPHLRIGQPERRDTDIGPLIGREQMDRAYLHIEHFRAKGRLIAQSELHAEHDEGYFVPPTLLRLYALDEIQEQVEAPVLHLVRFDRNDIARTLDEINRSGFAMALTLFSGDPNLGEQAELHSRVGELNINPPTMFPHSSSCPGFGIGLSGTAPLPGTADYLRALVRHQRVSRPPRRPAFDNLPE